MTPVDPAELALVAGVFLLAGAVKGVVGLGLPTVSLALLAIAFDLTVAMALLLVPSFVTNLWQAVRGGHGVALLRRLWPFLALASLAILPAARALAHVDHEWLMRLLGGALVAYAAVGLAGWRPSVTPANERWQGPAFGMVNGVLTGMTGSFVVPGVAYLQALGLERDALVQAMGLLFTLSTVFLAVALAGNGLVGAQLSTLSCLAVAPALAGMAIGQHLRARLDEQMFRRTLLAALGALGLYLLFGS